MQHQPTPTRLLSPGQSNLFVHFDPLLLRRALLLCFFIGLFCLIPAAMADDVLKLPTGDMKIPGAEDGASWSKMIASTIRWTIIIFVLAVFGVGLGKTILTLFALINDARNGGEWGPAIQQLGLVLLVVVMSFVVFAIINKYVLEPLGNVS